MDGGADELFSSPTDVSNSMPYELSWWTPEDLVKSWVFWSRQNNELQSILGSSFPSVDTSSSGRRTIADKIKVVLKFLQCYMNNYLIQFWTPVRTTEDRIYLTTADQPFGLTKLHKGLCLYRKLCVSSTLIPIDFNEMDDEEEHNLGPLARVFRREFPEFCSDVRYYLNKEYPQRDYAIKHGVRGYFAFPLFELFGQQCVGVLEILATSTYDSIPQIYSIDDEFEKMELKCHLRLPSNPWRDFEGVHKAIEAIGNICWSHQLPCAQLWTTSPTTRCIDLVYCYLANRCDWKAFDSSFAVFCMLGSKGVVEKAFSSRSACFCNNLSKLSISVYPLVPNARKFGLAGCFAICLQSTQVNDYFYILEFFLPLGGMDYGDPRNFLSMLVASLKKEIQSSMGAHVQKLGEKLFVEVIKTSSDDELDSFEICATTNNISAKQNDAVGPSARAEPLQNSSLQQSVMEPDTVNKDRDIATGRPCDISISGFGALRKRSTSSKVLDQGGNNIVCTQGDGSRSPRIESSHIRRVMQLDSSCQDSMTVSDHMSGGNLVGVDRDASAGARKQGQDNVITKQNIGVRFVPYSLPQQSVAVNDINGERSIRTEQDDANGSRKQGKVWTLDREYGISREVLEQHSGKKLKDVATILGVSRSTLKRTCRRHDIHRWPPSKTKRFRHSVNPQVSTHATKRQIEDQSLTNQSLPDLPQEIFSVSKQHTIPNAAKEQDTSSIMIKATYGDDMVKFPISLSSGKVNLEEEVAMRLNLSAGSFKIKYLDEDEDWVLVTCDADLRTCMSTLRSLCKTTIKMLVY